MNKKIIYLIFLVIIVAGIIISITLGFNKGLEYGDFTRITVYMTEANALEDVKTIIEESFNGRFEIAYTDEFNDTISVKARGISDEQLTEIKNKLVEKYTFEEEQNNISVTNTGKVEMYDLIKNYIKPVIISFLIVVLYTSISYRKIGMVKSTLEPLIQIIIINALYVSALAIFRIPINEFTIPLGIFIYVMSILGIIIKLNNKKMEA